MSPNPSNSSPSGDADQTGRATAAKFSRAFLLILLVGILVIFLNMVKIFLVPVILAAVFTTLFYPFYRWLVKVLRGNQGLSALLCCLTLILGLLVPTYLLADLVAREAVELYQSAEQKISEILEKGDRGPFGDLKRLTIVRELSLEKIDWTSALQAVAQAFGSTLATVINKTSKGTLQLLTNLFVTLFTMFYFFRDGDQLLARLKSLSPLDDIYFEGMIYRFVSVSRATVRGTLLVALIQGSLGAFTLWLFSVGAPILWGVVMVILSVIPFVGAWVVMYPAAIVQIIIGNIWQGVAIFLITLVIISNIDNLLRPRLVGRYAAMHDLMIFFSTLGGISMFGVMGFIIGPVIAVLLLTLLDIYRIEFRRELELARGGPGEEILEEPPAQQPLIEPEQTE